MQSNPVDPQLAKEAKAIVALAFRNGPVENLHAGKECPTCANVSDYSRISDAEMKLIMKNAVDQLYGLLWLRDNDPEKYAERVRFGESYTVLWDQPTVSEP